MTKIPTDDVPESLYNLRVRESDQLKTVLELYDMEIHQKLKTMVERSIDQRLRLRNSDARNERIEKGAVVTSRRALSGIEGGKGMCCQWKEKGECSKGDQCSFRHESNDHAPKPTPKAAPPSEPSMTRGGSASRKRSVRGRSQTDRFLRQPCKYYLKGFCTRSLCEYWHPPECPFYKTESGCKAGDVKSRTRAIVHQKKKEEKATTKMLWPLWKLYLNEVVCRKTRSHWILKEACSPGETRCKKSWDQFNEFTRSAPRQASIGENKGPLLGKIHVTIPHQRSPYAMKFEDRSQEETERRQRCAQSTAWNLAKNTYKLTEKDKASFHWPSEEWVLPVASRKRAGKKESLW